MKGNDSVGRNRYSMPDDSFVSSPPLARSRIRQNAGTLNWPEWRIGGCKMTESEWKLFRKLREVALDRFCQRVLFEVNSLASDTVKGNHERYLAIFKLIKLRDDELAYAFNNPRRSIALRQLASIRYLKLLTDEEFAGFDKETRDTIQMSPDD